MFNQSIVAPLKNVLHNTPFASGVKSICVVGLTAVMLVSACTTTKTVYVEEPAAEIPPGATVVQAPPPQPTAQAEVVYTAPSPDFVWVPGEWIWVGGSYHWRAGYWGYPPHPHAHWHPGGWHHHGGGYVWVEGSWKW